MEEMEEADGVDGSLNGGWKVNEALSDVVLFFAEAWSAVSISATVMTVTPFWSNVASLFMKYALPNCTVSLKGSDVLMSSTDSNWEWNFPMIL